MVSQSLIAFDTDQIKKYVFGTSKLKEIRGASSILDYLNRFITEDEAHTYKAQKIFAHGGSALFLIDSPNAERDAERLGQAVQKRYQQRTGGGASITYAVQPIPPNTQKNILEVEKIHDNLSMKQVLRLLHLKLRLAKDRQQANGFDAITQPSHAFLCTCASCGVAYAEGIPDSDEPENRCCRICMIKRKEDSRVKSPISGMISAMQAASNVDEGEDIDLKLWKRILKILSTQEDGLPAYPLSGEITPPTDFQAFQEIKGGQGYLGLIYADANSMGKAIEAQESLMKVQEFATSVDNAVFKAMGSAIKMHLPVQNKLLPFDILLVGGDDIVMVTSADKALDVACTLADKFSQDAPGNTLSVGVVLAPVAYPFNLQLKLAEEVLKDAKKAGALSQLHGDSASSEGTRISFVVVTGSTSLSYKKIRDETISQSISKKEEFQAMMRPYTLDGFKHLLAQLQEGKKLRLGRTKLHQLREAILKLNRTSTTLEALALFRNWHEKERNFIRDMVQEFDVHLTVQERKRRGTLFPWYLKGKRNAAEKDIYCTPLLDFIELYDFVSAQERGS